MQFMQTVQDPFFKEIYCKNSICSVYKDKLQNIPVTSQNEYLRYGASGLGRPGRRWVDNIRTGLQEVGCEYMDWIGLAQDRDVWWRLVSAVMKFRVP